MRYRKLARLALPLALLCCPSLSQRAQADVGRAAASGQPASGQPASGQPASGQPATQPVSRPVTFESLLQGAGVDPKALRCNRDNRWGATVRPDSEEGARDLMAAASPWLKPMTEEARAGLQKKLRDIVFWRMVRAVLIEGNNNNLGALPLKGATFRDDKGWSRPVVIFRSGLTPGPQAAESCFRTILQAGRVRHVVNLFDGDIPATDLVFAEQQVAKEVGASYINVSDDPAGYGPWRDTLRKEYDDPDKRKQATLAVARLVREQILRPMGGAPKGNIYFHCGGGMHRSGMIAGVIEKCVNREPMAVVEEHYRYHVGYKDEAHPGGLEEGNLRFLRDFDCGLLR